jgi:fructose-bisphosphate aldolase class II
MKSIADIMRHANERGCVIPAFNVPYLPMVQPVVRAVAEMDSFALIEVARLEWIKYASRSLAAVLEEYRKWENPAHVRLHLDHVPVIDEDQLKVDYLDIIQEAISLGYHSVMVDGSRLDLQSNIAATRQVAEMAHAAGLPCEAELGAVLGHEAGLLPPYEELFASGRGFTRVDEARRFSAESGCDWLSVAIGNIHGPISAALRDQKKTTARLNLNLLAELRQETGIPLVLHGGSGVRQEHVLAAIQLGISKINVGTEIRQAYEQALVQTGSVEDAQETVYNRTCWLIHDYYRCAGSRALVAV